jgi:hypothetical protein
LQSRRFDPKKRFIRYRYVSLRPALILDWEWRVRANAGPIEHRITVHNPGAGPITISLQPSLRLDFQLRTAADQLIHMWVDKGTNTPPPVGTHSAAITNEYHSQGKSSSYAHPVNGQTPEIIPWLLVWDREARQGWYAGIEFSGRVRLSLDRGLGRLSCTLELNPEPTDAYVRTVGSQAYQHEFRTTIPAQGRFTAPPAFLGSFAGDPEDAGNDLRKWVAAVLQPRSTRVHPLYPLLVNNTWGLELNINEAKVTAMMKDAAALGLEMLHVDAGWFQNVGDWYADPGKFPGGIRGMAERAHALGLKFGLWAAWGEAGNGTDARGANYRDPRIRDWLNSYPPASWRPVAWTGVTMDLGDPAVTRWCARDLDRIVREYHLDMLEHDGYLVARGCDRTDHPHQPPRGPSFRASDYPWFEGDNSSDVSYFAAQAYYAIQASLRRRHPGLLLEGCNDGGRMVDFGSAAHVDYFSITDTYDPLSNRRAFYDASHVLPPAMLECYVARYPAPTLETFRYALRSGMMGWCTIMQDTTAWTREEHDAAREEFAQYKRDLRPLIRSANLYHVSPRPDGVHWDGIQYFDPSTGQGALYAFRGKIRDEPQHRFRLRGLKPSALYQARFLRDSQRAVEARGEALMGNGITVLLPVPESSAIALLTEVDHG